MLNFKKQQNNFNYTKSYINLILIYIKKDLNYLIFKPHKEQFNIKNKLHNV